ncbi:MAG: 5'-nucleotidase C-terminal domain-containing protein [Byssovorax sp.]
MRLRHFLGSAALAACTAAACSLGASGCDSGTTAQTQLKGQVHLTLIHTSDIHSRLYPYNLQLGQIDAGLGLGSSGAIVNVGGAARVSHIVGRERARASRVLHLDGGDCFQGAPIFNFFAGEAEVRTMSAMGTDAMIVANHEFDRGALNLGIQLQRWASFPVLAANYRLEDPSQPGASPLGSILTPYTVFNLQGLRVGVVGMGNLSSLTSIFDTPNRLGIQPLNTIETAQFYVDLIRPQVDVVVFVTHLGLDVDERMIAGTTGIDVVLGGHNHIVLQPPKRVQDCSANTETIVDTGESKSFISLNGPDDIDETSSCQQDSDCPTTAGPAFCQKQSRCCSEKNEEDGKSITYAGCNPSPTCQPETGICKVKRFCEPRDVILAHSGAFAKYVGRLDLIVSNDKDDLKDRKYDPVNGFEVLTHDYHLFPVNEQVPEDPIVSSLLEPYHQSLDSLANLDLLVGYALDGSKRNATTGGDSPLGNLISAAMWLRLGIQTDFSLTNSTGIRADLVPGPVTVEQMYNIFPFDNSITKMQLSGQEVQDLFDFVARRSTGRGCVSQVQIAGARVVIDCTKVDSEGRQGVAEAIYIGTFTPSIKCNKDLDCPLGPDKAPRIGSCDLEAGQCWQPIDAISSYELATSNYLAGGGSGFRVLQRNTTQFDTKVQQRDALIDFIRAGAPCGAGEGGKLKDCKKDSDCANVGEGFVCACPEITVEGEVCSNDPKKTCSAGSCVLAKCRDDVASFQRATCEAAATDSVKKDCEKSTAPCASAGEQCKFLACVDRGLGNFSDGRVRMVGQ